MNTQEMEESVKAVTYFLLNVVGSSFFISHFNFLSEGASHREQNPRERGYRKFCAGGAIDREIPSYEMTLAGRLDNKNVFNRRKINISLFLLH